MVSTYHEKLMGKKIKALEARMDKLAKAKSAKGLKALEDRVEGLEYKVEDLEQTSAPPIPGLVKPED